MKFLRTMLNWVGRHRLVTLFILIVLLGSLWFLQVFRSQVDGEWSMPLQRGDIVNSVYGIGTVYANQSFDQKSGVISSIDAIYVKEGDPVKKGQRTLKIDSITYHAPFDGVITYLPNKVGETVFSQSIVMSIVDLTNRYLLVSMEQQGALRVHSSQSAILSFDSIRERNYEGKVTSVYSNAGNFYARIDVSHLPVEVLPGMTADVAIAIEVKKNALLVPASALEQGVLIVKRGHLLPKKVSVQVGVVDAEKAEIVSGDLKEGDQVLTRRQPTP